jgi:hypothetical protein
MELAYVMDFLLGASFWSTSAALWSVGAIAFVLIILWDWRLFLPGLALIQYGVGQILVYRYGVPGQWLAVYFWVMVLAALILALSPLQMGRHQPAERSGSPLFRGLILLLLAVIVYTLQPDLPLPVLNVATARLFLWLVACAFLVLALTDGALFTGIGLLLWFIPLQSLTAVILPLPSLIALWGILQLVVMLACAYLSLAENEQLAEQDLPITDVTFPVEGRAMPVFAPNWLGLRRLVAQRMAALMAMLKRVSQ